MKFFNTAGCACPEKHYYIPIEQRVDLDEIKRLIEQKKYFTLHAPRQTGKTTVLFALMKLLNESGQYKWSSPDLVEELIKASSAETLRSKIVRKIDELPVDKRHQLHAHLASANECLVTNYQSAPENLWVTLKTESQSRQVRLPNGVSVFFSREYFGRSNGRVAKIVDSALKDDRIIGEFVIL